MGEVAELMKAFNIKDGYALNTLLPQQGIIPIIITGKISTIVTRRAAELGITNVYQGVSDKVSKLYEIAKKFGIDLKNIAYIGDDDNDLEPMGVVGFSGCPADACDRVKLIAAYVCKRGGGDGAVREFAEYIVGQL